MSLDLASGNGLDTLGVIRTLSLGSALLHLLCRTTLLLMLLTLCHDDSSFLRNQ
jgi:hypothetical protein